MEGDGRGWEGMGGDGRRGVVKLAFHSSNNLGGAGLSKLVYNIFENTFLRQVGIFIENKFNSKNSC